VCLGDVVAGFAHEVEADVSGLLFLEGVIKFG
jgi:hypothetical protein